MQEEVENRTVALVISGTKLQQEFKGSYFKIPSI